MLLPIIFGFAMATMGVALLCVGEVPFLAGKRISAGRARLMGLVLVGFLPMAFALPQLVNLWFGRDFIEGHILTWSLFGVCWFVVIVILVRVLLAKKPHRNVVVSAEDDMTEKDFFGPVGPVAPSEEITEAIEETEPWAEAPPAKKTARKAGPAKKPPAQKAPKPSAQDNNPFDFT